MKNFTRSRLIEQMELLCGSVLPIIFWVSLIFGFDVPYVAVLTLVSAVIHEMGHYAAIYRLSEKKSRLSARATGFRISRAESLSYESEIIILLCGPMANIALFLLTLPFWNTLEGYVSALGLINLATGISNLMPFEGYDGYGVISEVVRSRGRHELIRRLEIFSFTVSTALTFLSLYLIERFGEGYWIFGLFFFGVMSKLVSFGKYDIFEE